MLIYKGLKATREHLKVSDEQVDRQIERMLEQHLKTIPVSGRSTQLDDEAVIDFTGYCDGEAFEGGSAEKYPIVLGSGAFIPGFEEQLIGHAVGEEFDVQVTFPVAYPVAALAGKEAVFHCKIHEIHVRQKYLADDEFAREVGQCESMDALRDRIRSTLQTYTDRQSDQELKDRLMDQLCEQFDGEITPEQLERALDIEMQELEAQLKQQNLTLDLYCQFMKQTRAQLREDLKPDAEKNVRRQRIIADIAEAEHIEADEASVANAFAALCEDNNLTIEQLQPYFDRQMESALTRSVIENKVLSLIRDNAVITEVEKDG